MREVLSRFFDMAFAAVGIVALSPLWVIITIAIRLTSAGPAFFRQSRVGFRRRIFQLVKFRTMVTDADSQGAMVTARGDSRITPIGQILRRTKLDELPELWNVLIGDMSLVGPRPEVTKYVAGYKPEWEAVFSVRPGITDLATLQFRDEEEVLSYAIDLEQSYRDVVLPIKISLAMEFIRKQSVRLYFKILFLTLWSITFGRVLAKPDRALADKAILLIRNGRDIRENNN